MYRKFLLAFLIIFLSIASISALEVGIETSLSNMYFPINLAISMSTKQASIFPDFINFPLFMKYVPFPIGYFPPNIYTLATETYLESEISNGFKTHFSTGFDPILWSYFWVQFEYSAGPMEMGIGPYIGGLFNTMRAPTKNGIIASVRLNQPGLFFISGRVISSFLGLLGDNDYIQEAMDFEFGFYVKRAICSISYATRGMILQLDDNGVITHSDMIRRYLFNIDAFKKGTPYNFLIKLGYQETSNEYKANSPNASDDHLGCFLIGTRFTLRPNSRFSIFADMETSFFNFGTGTLAGNGPKPESFMFNAKIGISYNFKRPENYIPE